MNYLVLIFSLGNKIKLVSEFETLSLADRRHMHALMNATKDA